MSESAIGSAAPAPAGETPLSLKAAIGQFLGCGRVCVAHAAELVRAEPHAALPLQHAAVIPPVRAPGPCLRSGTGVQR